MTSPPAPLPAAAGDDIGFLFAVLCLLARKIFDLSGEMEIQMDELVCIWMDEQ